MNQIAQRLGFLKLVIRIYPENVARLKLQGVGFREAGDLPPPRQA